MGRRFLALLATGVMASSYLSCASTESSCGSDKDCNPGEICTQHQCVPYHSPTETPQQVFNGWVSALAENDLNGSLSYWTPGLREKCKAWLTNPDLLYSRNILPANVPLEQALPVIAQQIQGATLVPIVEKGGYFEYRLEKRCNSNSECPRQGECIASQCALEQLIIFDKLYDPVNQKDVFKIRSF